MIIRERRGGRRRFGDIGDQFPPNMHTHHSDSLEEVNERWEASFLDESHVHESLNELSVKRAKRVQFSEEIKVALIWHKESRNNGRSIILPVRPEDAVNNILYLDARPRVGAELLADRSRFIPKSALKAPSEPVITEEEDDSSTPSFAPAEEFTLTPSEAPASNTTDDRTVRSFIFSRLLGSNNIFSKAQQWLERQKQKRALKKQKRQERKLDKEALKAEMQKQKTDRAKTALAQAEEQKRSTEGVQNQRQSDAAKKYVARP
ncbi:hypothetical protein BJ742DRAFT_819148 [Cladochytrium replicatum]|nr:hypothetical protein BJ742DRAFT_819148 [Cladochytrium replicatum]